ncbi:MAG: EAL domain-containing protein [Lachnospiraceae bacterium]|nr:EAL domain-containing protein [Lachnospiraceae bacterium]
MIRFDKLPLNTRLLNAFSELNIDFVFQPIYSLKENKIFAYEALMQPAEGTLEELFDSYTRKRELHTLELATFYGATMAYCEKGYKEPFFVNSFPCELFLPMELEEFDKNFPKEIIEKIMVQIIEYPELNYMNWNLKKKQFEARNTIIALDNFGAGYNDITTSYIVEPHIVMLDKDLIENIANNTRIQHNLKKIIDMFHKDNILVIAKGIEKKEDYEYIMTTDVDYVQGFYLGRPE